MRPAPSPLRLITCGSVDDGKSTLVGRMLFESMRVPDDRLKTLRTDSRKWGTQGGDVDFSLLTDGLLAEREQRITIDVAHCYFETSRRKFIVIDAPGHEQYTRNMVTGASNADVAVILVDARKGLSAQTRRHSSIAHLMNIEHIVLAVNKMDLLAYSEDPFRAIESEFSGFASRMGLPAPTSIPMSALQGQNVVASGSNMPWYSGPTLLSFLEDVQIREKHRQTQPLRLPVQWVNRPHLDFRGLCGQLASGMLYPGMPIRVQPSGRQSRIARIVAEGGDRDIAVAGESVTVTLEDDIDVSRGDVISALDEPAEIADQFECSIVWMHDEPLYPGRSYLLKIGTCELGSTVTSIRYKVDTNNLERLAAKTLALNEIGVCHLALDRRIPFDAFEKNSVTGGFILIDRISFNTIGVGMLRFALRRSHSIALQPLAVDKASRAMLNGQRPVVLWFTGLCGAGKSTIANLVEAKLFALGRRSYLLDGDNVRLGLNRDLGFTDADRVENIRRVAEVAKLMVDAGLIVLAAFISPFRAERDRARASFNEGEFFEIYVDTPIEMAEQRDVKGLYKKARLGQLHNFTGIDSPYEVPMTPDLRVSTATTSAESAANLIIDRLRSIGIFTSASSP